MKTAEKWFVDHHPQPWDTYGAPSQYYLTFIRAIQNDALEAAENAVNGKAYDGAVAAIRALKT